MKKGMVHLISAGILAAIVINDVQRVQTGIVAFPPLLREVLLTVVLLIQVIRVSWNRSTTQSDLIAHLQGSAVSILFLWVLNFILSRQMDFDPDSFGTLPLKDMIVWTVFGIVLIMLLIRMLYFLMGLVYVQQGQHTEHNLRLFYISIFLLMGYNLFKSDPWEIDVFQSSFHFGTTPWEKALFGVVLLFAFILGFRTKWIHYLKKSQKWRILFFGTLIFAFSQTYIYFIPETIQPYSNMLRVFTSCVMLLWTVYGGMALLGILFHLPTAGLIDRRVQEIETLQNLSTTISSIFQTDQLIDKTTSMARQIVGADCAWIEMKAGDTYRIVGLQKIKKTEIDRMPQPGLKLLRESALQQKEAILINHIIRDKRTAHLKKWRGKSGSLMATRLCFKDRTFGVLYAFCERTFCFVEDSRGMFQAFGNQVAIALENANLVEISIEQERYREELRLAHEAQMRLLPRTMPDIPGAEIDGLCITANDIGGDFYDLIPVGEKRIDIMIGDVSGKGADAAFYMAEIKGVVQTLASLFGTPGEILREVNTFVRRHFDPEMFVTMVYAIYDPAKRRLHFARAGHTPVIHMHKDKITSLEPGGLGLGLAENPRFYQGLKEEKINLSVGDKVIFFTDGLIEARNPKGEEFGEDRLHETLGVSGGSAAETVAALRRRVDIFREQFPMHDDLTLVILNVTT